MNLANIHGLITNAMSKTYDVEVTTPLQAALDEINEHMDKEKERVKKYRSKEYRERKTTKHDHSKVSGICPTCGTNVGGTLEPVIEKFKETFPETKVFAERVKPKPSANPMDEALELLDAPMPTIHHDGVMDDLEDDAPVKDALDGVLDDLDSILSF